ncbi:MAG: DUF4167 domain-containing protein [Proteobacteria bacterium]|nr:DUF4167 domain-containing protein [Pseudomonadota bacterium]
MRDFRGMKRQRGRNRKPGGGGGGGGGGQSNNPNRAFESNGPENLKIRGNAQHVYERYQQLARDAFTSGDRVLAENYLQHAEHYFRVLRTLQPSRPVAEIVQRDAFASGFDIDFEDESGEQAVEMDGVAEAGETEGGDGMNAQAGQGGEQRRDRDDYRRDERGEGRNEGRRDREYRDDRPRDRDNREFRDRDGNREGGRDRDRGDYRRDDREPRPDREFRGERNEGRGERNEPREPRPEGQGGQGQGGQGQGGEGRREGRRDRFERRDRNRNRDDQPAGDPLAVVEPRAEALPSSSEAAPAPFAGDDSHMPAFLRQAPPAAEADAAPAEKPKRAPRRKKTESFEDTPAD